MQLSLTSDLGLIGHGTSGRGYYSSYLQLPFPAQGGYAAKEVIARLSMKRCKNGYSADACHDSKEQFVGAS
jgi:hypothetical protein